MGKAEKKSKDEPETVTVIVNYDVKSDKITFGGNANKQGQVEIIENFLRRQIGAGTDSSEPNRKTTNYCVKLEWNPMEDAIDSEHNAGSKGLRDGILMLALKRLSPP